MVGPTTHSFGRAKFAVGSWLCADEDGVIVCREWQDEMWAFERELLE